MAALRGTLVGNRGTVSRLGSRSSGIVSRLNTWEGAIRTSLDADGNFWITIEPNNGRMVELSGNVDQGIVDQIQGRKA
jgi:hypothetical protein